MSLSRLIPLVSLALVLVVLGAALLFEGDVDFPFTEPPEGASLPGVDLGLGGLTLHGLLVDDLGAPVPDAGVTTYQKGRPLWTWTRSDGSFELTELRPDAITVLVNGLGFEATSFEVDVAGETTADEPVRLVLDRRISEPPEVQGLRAGSLAGSVALGPHASEDGTYEVLFWPKSAADDPTGGFPCRAAVESDGSFEVELLHAGTYRVVLLAPEDRGGRGPDLLQGGDGSQVTFEHVIGGDAPVLELASKAGCIQGVVARQITVAGVAENRPLRGGLVRAEPIGSGGDLDTRADRPSFRGARTDSLGRYVLRDLVPGRYRVTVVAGSLRETHVVEVIDGEAADLNVITP